MESLGWTCQPFPGPLDGQCGGHKVSQSRNGRKEWFSICEGQGQRETWLNVHNVKGRHDWVSINVLCMWMLSELHCKPTCDYRYTDPKGEEMGLREASSPKSQAMNWEMFWRQACGVPAGTPHWVEGLTRPSLGPLEGSLLLHEGPRGATGIAQGSSLVLLLLGLQKSLTSCCLGLPICELGIEFHYCTASVYPWSLSD